MIDRLDFAAVREEFPDRYNRATISGTSVVSESGGQFIVSYPDSDDSHVCQLVETPVGFFGTCGCKGYQHHDGPCSHLCAVQRFADEGHVPIRLFEIHAARGDLRDPAQERADQWDGGHHARL